MCNRCDTLAFNVTAEVLLAEAERDLILAQTDAGESVPGAIRPLSDVERRAKMRFGEIEALEHSAAEEAAKLLASNAQVYVIAIIGAIFGSEDAVEPGQVVDAVEQINRAQPKAVITETARAQKDMSEILRQVYAGAAQIVIGEAIRQGVKKTPAPLTAEPDRFDQLAKAVALHPWTRLTGKLQADMLEPRTLGLPSVAKADVTKALEAIPLDGAEDLAKQTIHAAHGAGRVEAAETMQPEEIYSSELMDGATCDACAKVDGKDYDTMAEAKIEYEAGGYGACKGGARCRGTLVFQYNGLGTDAPPPAPEPDPVAPPKTPRKRKPKTPPPAPPAPVLPDVIANPPLTRRQALELERQNAEQNGPAAPGLPPAPTGTPPKRRKGTSQRYDSIDQLPIDHALAKAKVDDIAAETNPGYNRGRDKNYGNNCSSVANAYEMQRRGYAVKAAPVKAGKGRYDTEYVGEWWTNPDGTPAEVTYVKGLPAPTAKGKKILPNGSVEAKAKLDEHIEAMPDGARGFVALHFTKGGGHVFNFEKVNGKPVYLEGQNGLINAGRHLEAGQFDPKSLRVFRADDKIPTELITTALETRPAEFLAELADTTKLPTVAIMKQNSQHRVYTTPFGDRMLDLAKYRVNPFTRKWEEIPADVLKQIQTEFDRTEALRKKTK